MGREEHRGLDHNGVERECVQEVHFCIDDYGPPIVDDEAIDELLRLFVARGYTPVHARRRTRALLSQDLRLAHSLYVLEHERDIIQLELRALAIFARGEVLSA